MFLIFFMHILYGSTFTISKILVKFAPPIFVIGLRMLIAGTLLMLFYTFFTKEKENLDWISIKYILQIGVIGIFLPYTLRYWSLTYLPVTKTAIIYNLSPFVAYFFSYLFFKEKPSARKWLGLICGFLGVLPLLIAQETAGEAGLRAIGFLSFPELAMLGSVTSFSYGWIIMKRLVMHNKKLSSLLINGLNMLIGGVCALSTSFFLEPQASIDDPMSFIFWLFLIIIATNMICYNLYAHLLKKYSATLLSLAGLIAPVSAGFTSYFYFGETIGWASYLSGLLVIIGFLIFYSDQLKSKPQTNNEREKKDEPIQH